MADKDFTSDRELLEMAAKAAGYEVRGISAGGEFLLQHPAQESPRPYHPTPWNPLSDDGDALRLAVKLRINIDLLDCTCCVNAWAGQLEEPINERFDEVVFDDGPNKRIQDPEAATRRAIVRAAASIGSAL